MTISIFGLLQSVMLARALFVAAELDIAEHLTLKALTASELAQVTNTDPQALKRLLYFLELHDVFNQQTDHCYYLTDFSKTMCHDHPHTIKPFLLHDDETRWNSFGHLGYCIRSGKSAFEKLYNTTYFQYLEQQPVLSTRFNDAMTIISAQEDALIAKTISFKNTVADIGGGNGQLLTQIAQSHPISHGILFDLPQTVSQINNLPATCTKVGGSFFEPIAIAADIFILKRILHDWDDQAALNVLQNISNAMSPDAKLYIIDGVLDYAQDKKLLAAIDLALLTIFQGQERTSLEFTKLANAANLKINSITPLNDLVCIIECVKA